MSTKIRDYGRIIVDKKEYNRLKQINKLLKLAFILFFLAFLCSLCYPKTLHPAEFIYYQIKFASEEAKIINEIREQAQLANIDPELMVRIAKAESNFKPNAYNPISHDYGIFQISYIHKISKECLYDYRCNIAEAIKLFKRFGPRPWNASRHNWK